VPAYADAYLLLADIHEKQGRKDEVMKVLSRALTEQGISSKTKEFIKSQLEKVEIPAKPGPRIPLKNDEGGEKNYSGSN
jgi:hypothetical protein